MRRRKAPTRVPREEEMLEEQIREHLSAIAIIFSSEVAPDILRAGDGIAENVNRHARRYIVFLC